MNPAIDDVRIELSALDLPEAATDGLHLPTMRQSQDVTLGFYNGLILGTDALSDVFRDPTAHPVQSGVLRYALQLPVVWFTAELPIPAQVWLHEEWHRAPLRVSGVHSRNGNSPRLWQGTVYDVSDADLSALKASDPPAWNRALAGGLEAEVELSRRIVREDFFLRDSSHLPAVLLFDAWHTWHYWRLSAGPIADDIREWNLENQGGELERDFAGLDPLALTRDLFRPDEPYEARGPHPSGEGLARPVAWSDLTEAEQDWALRRRDWSLLNFVNPMAFGLHHVPVGAGWGVNGMLHHRATSFGSRTGVDLLADGPTHGWVLGLALDRNLSDAVFGGVELTAVRVPVGGLGVDLALTPKALAWWQPRALDPYTPHGAPGGLLSLRADARLQGRWSLFVEGEAKSRGEVSGNPFLDPMGAVRAGVTLETAGAWTR